MTATATKAPDKPGLLFRIGHFCAHRHRMVLAVWVVIAIVILAAGFAFGGREVNDFALPGTEAQAAEDLLTSQFPMFAGGSAQVVFESKLSDPRFEGTPENSLANVSQKDQIDKTLAAVAALDHVQSVGDPFAGENGGVSQNLQAAFAEVTYDQTTEELGPEPAKELIEKVNEFDTSEITAVAGGDLISENANISGLESELVGLIAALIILLIVLGSAVAMAIPISVALIAVVLALSLIFVLANFVNVPTSANDVAIMIGLGVGIDYSLFITSRYRSFLHGGAEPTVAAGRAIATSGRAVVTAGSTVIVALLGLAVFQVPIINALAAAVVIMVVVAIAVAITLLPTVLGFIGTTIDKGRPKFLNREHAEGYIPLGFRWSRLVTSRTTLFLVAGVLILLVLALPTVLAPLQLGPTDASDGEPGSPARESADIVSDNFGPGFNGPLVVTVQIPSSESANATSDVDEISNAVKNTTDVDLVAPAEFNTDNSVAVIEVIPKTGPKDTKTTDLVNELRDETLPKATEDMGVTALVGGLTAAFVDLDERIGDRLALFIAIVIGISIVILGTVFRSVAIPIKAAILNVLIIGASYGIVVAVFQWGWLESIIGTNSTGPIVSFIPPFMFAVIFGLSMDYEVYLMSRISEEYHRTNHAHEAVVYGTGKASRMIIAAALIMFFVFASFIPIKNTIIQTFGVGLAIAILLDAFIARMVLVPTSLYLLGDRAFWLPKWLEKILPNLSVEGNEAPSHQLDDSEEIKEVARQ